MPPPLPRCAKPAGASRRAGAVRWRRGAAVLLLLAACLPGFGARAQAVVATTTADATRATPGTGDPWIDAHLLDIDRYAARYRDAFVDELVRYRGAPRAMAEQALADDTRAGDLYFACALAQATGRACRAILDARAASPGSWEALARSYEVPALTQIHRRIRGDISESYLRWARPLASRASR